MKVLQINSVCGVGSTGRIATDIDKILKGEGHESYIAYGRGKALDSETTIKIGQDFDNYMHVVKTRVLDKHGYGSKKATKEFIIRVKELDPDIIHLHNIHGYYLNIEMLFDYLKIANKPVVWTLHDCWPFTGHCSYFDYVGCNKWKNGCHNCPQKKSYPTSFLVDNSKRNYSSKKEIFTGVKNLTIITPSEWLSGIVKNSFLGEYPVKVINNGIDLDTFKPTKSNLREKYNLKNIFVILGVASGWEQRKGYNYFIELSNKLKKDEKIVMVGLTEKQKGSLPNNIIGITRTNSVKELAEIYSTADVFINPTLEDNYPTTNLESLACGTPVIAFQTGGVPEQIKIDCGFIVKKGDSEGLYSTISEIKERGKTSYIDASINAARLNFSKENNYAKYLNLYSNLSVIYPQLL
jgi:putative colanic acid biosynthesis glycosyltransferase